MLGGRLGLEGLVRDLRRGPMRMGHGGGHLAVAASLESKRKRIQFVVQRIICVAGGSVVEGLMQIQFPLRAGRRIIVAVP